MAATLNMHCVEAVNKGQHSRFYPDDKNNPVLQALDQEIKMYVAYMKKRATPGYKPPNDEPSSRAADTLFQLWNKYEHRLDRPYFQTKLLEMGDFLASVNEYQLALLQCYGRYLTKFGEEAVEEVTTVQQFTSTFFPDGFDAEDTTLTLRGLLGLCVCKYQVAQQADPKLQNSPTVDKCLTVLRFLRLITQVILPKETLCWLVYNGTLHIYSICRHLLSMGRGAVAVEFLLWASMCMEASVPLLAVRYLVWRTTLYTAVCQCYYDCNLGQHGEAFARRAISKINELSQLESMSNSEPSRDTEQTFRHATVQMAAMVFKRTVFETRRKPKGLLRPKTRANLKDAEKLPWPRTPTERLLAELVEGSAGQLLLVLEALSSSHRRTLLTTPPAPDADVEILDVYCELFMAAQEIVAGGGGTLSGSHTTGGGLRKGSDVPVPGLGGIRVGETSLMAMARRGDDGVPITSLVTLAKLAYTYEQWEYFDLFMDAAQTAIKEVNEPEYSGWEKTVELLYAHDRVVPRPKQRKLFTHTGDDDDDGGDAHTSTHHGQPFSNKDGGTSVGAGDDSLIQLAEVLLSIITGPFTQESVDMDMLVDACLLLWRKCKEVFQRFQTGSTDNPKYLHRMDNPSKWVYILDIVHQVLSWTGLSTVDPALTAEVVLRLALVFEASASLDSTDKARKTKSAMSGGDALSTPISRDSPGRRSGFSSSYRGGGSPSRGGGGLLQGAVDARGRDQLLQARDILELGLQNVSLARHSIASSTDGNSIADISWNKELNGLASQSYMSSLRSDVTSEEEMEELEEITGDGTAIWNTIKDLHTEMLFMYHRVCLKLAHIGPDPMVKNQAKAARRLPDKPYHRKKRAYPKSRQSVSNGQEVYIETFDELVSFCQRNRLSKALLYMQKALTFSVQASHASGPSSEQKKHLEEAMSLIRKAEAEEKRLYVENAPAAASPSPGAEGTATPSKVPPPPILLCRTDTTLTLKPAPFKPAGGQKVAWYRLFCRSASGSNVKVRLNDYFLQGTGEEIPAAGCELSVTGLVTGEKYVCAVAAYSADGKLIGDAIGLSTRPIPAAHPIPLLMCWAYLCQVAYQAGEYAVVKEACDVLWNHFVAEPPASRRPTFIKPTPTDDLKLTRHKLNQSVVGTTSPVLLRLFLNSLFIRTDVNVREAKLFPDMLCNSGPHTKSQVARLEECEHLLVALELAGWLNEGNYALQAVVQCYGLLAPLIHYRIPSPPVIQVLERCLAVLNEIPVNLRTKRPHSIVESLNHMIACLTYHLAKVLRGWQQRTLASTINDQGRKLLTSSTDAGQDAELKQHDSVSKIDEHPQEGGGQTTDTGSLTMASLKKKRTTRKLKSSTDDHGTHGGGNEELRALEAHMLRISKQNQGEHELTGSEEPSILHAHISYLPSRLAIKEVNKFRRRARYLEFFVQTVQKALSEGRAENALDWCHETNAWLQKRNEQILGIKTAIGKQPGAVTITGDDPKKYAAALVEYSKDKESPRGKKHAAKASAVPKVKKAKYKPVGITPNMSDTERIAQEALELRALELLSLRLLELYAARTRRRKLRRVSQDERPWRAQLYLAAGVAQCGVLLSRWEARERVSGTYGCHVYSTSFLDPEWFEFETAGTLVTNWQTKRHQQELMRPVRHGETHPQVIDIAAMATTTGKTPPSLFPIMPEEEDTPRTYRSDNQDQSPRRAAFKEPLKKKFTKEKTGNSPNDELSRDEALQLLKQAFQYFTRAVVLAHRGSHWTLLQNAGRCLWNCAHTALIALIGPDMAADRHGQVPFVEVDSLRAIITPHFYMAADLMLDMLLQLQKNTPTPKKKKEASDEPPAAFMPQSVTGQQEQERGGAGLKFESPLDDMSSVDVRWLRRLVLRVLEMLFYQEHWEKLVDLALRFNALTDERYAEQVMPLLVQAQRKLRDRVTQHGGPMPQPHYSQGESGEGTVVSAKEYTVQQLRVAGRNRRETSAGMEQEIAPGAMMDPRGTDIYGGGLRAKQLCCVPLDVDSSLSSLRSALNNTKYTARALQHSRKLLVLYLSGLTSTNEPVSPPRQASPKRGSQRSHRSTVEFDRDLSKPLPSMPSDISADQFMEELDVKNTPLPKSQVATVISSYEKTIELLVASNQKGLAAEAMRELGNVHYHNSNVRNAYKYWCEALDTLLGVTDAVHQWRDQLNTTDAKADPSHMLLDKIGLWGCLLGGIIASNIAQYVLTTDLGLRTECCFLAGHLFKAVFRSSLPHPKSDRDYALYEVGGEGSEVPHLIPGLDMLSERFRCDGRTLMAALRFVMEDLTTARHNLFALPIIALYLHLATVLLRDVASAVWGRVVLARALTDLSLHSEALVTIQRLLYGERLPHFADTHTFRQTEAKIPTARFNNAKPILDPANIKVLESFLDKKLPQSLATLYGPHLTCMVALVHAHVLSTIAASIPVMPAFDELTPGKKVLVQPHIVSDATKSSLARNRRAPKTPDGQDSLKDSTDYDEKKAEEETKPQRGFGDKPELERLKGVLLFHADRILSTMTEVIVTTHLLERSMRDMTETELEVVVLSHVELAIVAQQRHHAVQAGRLAHTAMTFLQDAIVFLPKAKDMPAVRKTSALRKSRSPSGERGKKRRSPARKRKKGERGGAFQFEQYRRPPALHLEHVNAAARARLGPRLWLACRLRLVTAMLAELRGLGQVKGGASPVESSLGSVRQYCAEGVAEAEAAGDTETYAHFLYQAAILNLMDGRPITDTKQLLEDILTAMSKVARLSVSGRQLQATVQLLLTDMQAAAGEPPSSLRQKYLNIHAHVLNQLEYVGEKIESRFDGRTEHDCPASPLVNLYIPQLLLLVQSKLRLGHSMAREAVEILKHNPNRPRPEQVWTGGLGVLTTALEVSKVSAMRVASVEAEILLHMGKIQRQLFNMGCYEPRAAANTLIDAITTSFTNDHNLGLMRHAYLEIALIYLWSSGAVMLREDGTVADVLLAQDSEDEGAEEKKPKKKAKRRESEVAADIKAQRKKSVRLTSKEELPVEETSDEESKKEKPKAGNSPLMSKKEQERRAAWIAIRCAAAVGEAQRARTLLVGATSVTSQSLTADQQQQIPEFLLMDLLHPYVLGERKKFFKTDIEEEMAPLAEALEPPPIETYSAEIQKLRQAAGELSWTHIIGYQTILQRLCNSYSMLDSRAPKLQPDNNDNQNNTSDPDSAADQDPDSPKFDMSSLLLCDTSAQNVPGEATARMVGLMLGCESWALRMNHLHAFLARMLSPYGLECTASYPPRTMMLTVPEDKEDTHLEVVVKKYYGNIVIPLDMDPEASTVQAVPAPGSQVGKRWMAATKVVSTRRHIIYMMKVKDPSIRSAAEQHILSVTDDDLCLQWFSPSLEATHISCGAGGAEDPQTMLIYASGKKKDPRRHHCAFMWVSLAELHQLHDKLSYLSQRAEISLVEKPKPSPSTSTSQTGAGGKGKKQARIKALSPKVKRDEKLEAILQQCMEDVYSLLGYVPPPPPVPEVSEEAEAAIQEEDLQSPKKKEKEVSEPSPRKPVFPFDVSKSSLNQLERVFDPCYGLCLKERKLLAWMLQCFTP